VVILSGGRVVTKSLGNSSRIIEQADYPTT
jgi:hypothetical protein